MPMNEPNFVIQSERARRVDISWRDDDSILPEQAVDCHADDERQGRGNDEEKQLQ